MRQTELRLSKQEREVVEGFRSKGEHMAREFNRAHILAALDRKIPESLIMQVLGVGRTAIWRTRAAYLEGGLEYALSDVQRPGQPKRYRAPEEAQVTALACSSPPAGAKRWKDIWSAGHGVAQIHEVQPISQIVESLMKEAHDVVAAFGR